MATPPRQGDEGVVPPRGINPTMLISGSNGALQLCEASPKTAKNTQVIPLYAAIGAGVGLCTTFGLRHLLACPDV